jgi:tetraacyldisaccharide 4'-kinase
VFRLQNHWLRRTPISLALLPLAAMFALLVGLRRAAYRLGLRRTHTVGVPLIVVGNITAGGSGKTPLVIWLVQYLQTLGYRPGVVSRGYGGSATATVPVQAASDPAAVGEEPLLIHAKTGAPVVVGRDRVDAARVLLARYPGIDCIVSDDGLQHYALHRDLELAVLDTATGLGNGLPLPAGPLREPASRLRSVDAVVAVMRDDTRHPGTGFPVRFGPGRAYRLCDPARKLALAELPRDGWLALAGIGRPQGFFDMLTRLGWQFTTRVFADHHQYRAQDIPPAARVVMTEKDAVKCRRFAQPDWWAIELDVQPDPALLAFVADRLCRLTGHTEPNHASR